MSPPLSGAARVAGVVGAPVRHSLSPLIHNAWIAGAGLDAAYVPFSPPESGFAALVQGFRGGAIRGLNVTLPFKEQALALADSPSAAARAAALGESASARACSLKGRVTLRPRIAPPRNPWTRAAKPDSGGLNGT